MQRSNKEYNSIINMTENLYAEFIEGYGLPLKKSTKLIYLLATTYIVYIIITKKYLDALLLLVFLVIIGITKLIQINKKYKIKLKYTELLLNNNDMPLQTKVKINDKGISTFSNGVKSTTCNFSDIKDIKETKNLIIIKLNSNAGFFIDKNTLTGGSFEELISFFISRCDKVKEKNLKRDKNKELQIIYLIIWILLLGLLLLPILLK